VRTEHLRLAVVLHHAVLRTAGGLFTKEVWHDYLEEAVRPHFRSVDLLAPVCVPSDGRHEHLTRQIDEAVFGVVQLPEYPKTDGPILTRMVAASRLLRQLWAEVGRHDVLWILLPTWRGLAAAVIARLRRKPYVAYLGGDYIVMTGRNSYAP